MTDLEEHILQQFIALEGWAKAAARSYQKANDGKARECLFMMEKIIGQLVEDIGTSKNGMKEFKERLP